MELDLCKEQLEDYEDERNDEDRGLQSQFDTLDNVHQALKVEFQQIVEDKSKLEMELAEVKSERDTCKSELGSRDDQFLKLKEAVEKYRLEAAEAIQRCERSEEKLQECTREQDEVWRRCNIAEAQATETAHELAQERFRAKKIDSALAEHKSLVNDMYAMLTKATEELDSTKEHETAIQKQLDEVNSQLSQWEQKFRDSEEERNKINASLVETVTTCERLAETCREKDSQLEQVTSGTKCFEDKLSDLERLKTEAEGARNAILSQQEQLLSQVREEKERELEEERRLSKEGLEKVKEEMDNEVKKLTTSLQMQHARVEELEKLVDSQLSTMKDNEDLRKVAETEANKLRQDLEQMRNEVAEQKLTIGDLTAKLQSATLELSSLSESKTSLESKSTSAEEMISRVDAVERDKDEMAKRLSETSLLLEETKEKLETLTAEHQSLRSAGQEAEKKLTEVSSAFESLKQECEVLTGQNQSLMAEVERRSVGLQTADQKHAGLESSLADQVSKITAAETHIKELEATISSLKSDVADMERVKSELHVKTTELDTLRSEGANRSQKLADAETACRAAQEDCRQLKESVQNLEEEKKMFSQKILELESSSSTVKNVIQSLEEEKVNFLATIDDLQVEKKSIECQISELGSSLAAREEALRESSASLEDANSKLLRATAELQTLEAKVSGQKGKIQESEVAYQALENECSRLSRTVSALQEDKEVLTGKIGEMELASKALEDSLESLKQEKIALQASLGSHLEHSEKTIISQHPTEEDVKDVDIANHVIRGETQVCIDPGTAHIDLLVSKKGSHVDEIESNMHPVEKGEDRRPREQETDARLVAALTDNTDVKSHVGGSEAKMDLALKAPLEAIEQEVALCTAHDLEAQVAVLTDDCRMLREALFLANNRNSTLELKLGKSGEEYEQLNYKAAELEKELQSALSLLEMATGALGEKTTEVIELLRQVGELSAEKDGLHKEIEKVSAAKLAVERTLSSTATCYMEIEARVADLCSELDVLRLRVDTAVADRPEWRSVDIRSENRSSRRDETSVSQHGGRSLVGDLKLKVESRLATIVTEKEKLEDRLNVLEEQLVTSRESAHLGSYPAEEVVVLRRELTRVMAEKEDMEAAHRHTVESLHSRIAELRSEAEGLANEVEAKEHEIANLRAETSSLLCCEQFLRTTLAQYEAELSLLTQKLGDRDLQIEKLTGQNSQFLSDLQELRDEIQYSLGEVEYEFQKHVIDTEERLKVIESEKAVVHTEVQQLAARTAAENDKFASMLAALDQLVVGHRATVETWVGDYNSLDCEVLRMKNEALKMKDLETFITKLQGELVEEQKMSSESKQEVLLLRKRLAEQAKKNPFSWNSSSAVTARPEARAHQPNPLISGTEMVSADEIVPRFASQQKKRVALSSKDRMTARSKSSNSKKVPSSSLRVLNETLQTPAVPSSAVGNIPQVSRSVSRLRSATPSVPTAQSVDRSKRPALSSSHTTAPTRQPLRSITNNLNTLETSRHAPALVKLDPSTGRSGKVTREQTPKLEVPTGNNKRRRLA
ncbi:hypothetical protein R1sor_007545 [Riccia sorocarpa]|uniref:Nuclear mitotic apparatus protein 1 n=1 Tax=Riccia sorocarpa TaxID=122646 RepID=A0ABD3HTC2_9MARC